MVDLVLDDLCCPAGEGLEPSLELLVLPLYFNSLETLPSKLVTSSVSGEWYTISPLLKVYRAIIKDNLKLENKHLTQRAIVTAPTAFPMVALHRRLASTVGTTNRLSSRCIMASGVSVARSNTNNNHNQDYDSENNESKHNILPSLPLISITVICYFKAIPVLDMILHLFSSHINRTADICLLS